MSQMQIFVKLAETFSLKLQVNFTQKPTKNQKQINTFQQFLPESSPGQVKPNPTCEKLPLNFGRIGIFLHFSQSVPLDNLKSLWRKMAKRFRSAAKGNQSNSDKLQVENQKNETFYQEKEKKKNTKKNLCNRRLQFWEYPRNSFSQKTNLFCSKSIQ